MRAKTLPVLYYPYLLWPAKSERSSGFLVPNIGYSERRGAELGLAYFQTLGRSYDTTFHLDTYTKGFLGLGNEFRYAPTAGTKGDLIGYSDLRSRVPGPWRWKLELNHITNDLPLGMRGRHPVPGLLGLQLLPGLRARLRPQHPALHRQPRLRRPATGGRTSLNLLLDSRETFGNQLTDDTLIQRQLPELQYRLRSTQIAKTPFYLEVASSASYLDVDKPNAYQGQYGRFDLFPQVTLPMKTFPWLTLAVTGGERLTWYGDSLNQTQTAFTGNALTRAFPFGERRDRRSLVLARSSTATWATSASSSTSSSRASPTPTRGRSTTRMSRPSRGSTRSTPSSRRTPAASRSTTACSASRTPRTGVAREILLFEIARNYSFDNNAAAAAVAPTAR